MAEEGSELALRLRDQLSCTGSTPKTPPEIQRGRGLDTCCSPVGPAVVSSWVGRGGAGEWSWPCRDAILQVTRDCCVADVAPPGTEEPAEPSPGPTVPCPTGETTGSALSR